MRYTPIGSKSRLQALQLSVSGDRWDHHRLLDMIQVQPGGAKVGLTAKKGLSAGRGTSFHKNRHTYAGSPSIATIC